MDNEIDRQPSAARADAAVLTEYENKRQLAARLGVSVRTVDNLLTRGIPHVKLTRKLLRFPRGAVDEWLAGRILQRGR